MIAAKVARWLVVFKLFTASRPTRESVKLKVALDSGREPPMKLTNSSTAALGNVAKIVDASASITPVSLACPSMGLAGRMTATAEAAMLNSQEETIKKALSDLHSLPGDFGAVFHMVVSIREDMKDADAAEVYQKMKGKPEWKALNPSAAEGREKGEERLIGMFAALQQYCIARPGVAKYLVKQKPVQDWIKTMKVKIEEAAGKEMTVSETKAYIKAQKETLREMNEGKQTAKPSSALEVSGDSLKPDGKNKDVEKKEAEEEALWALLELFFEFLNLFATPPICGNIEIVFNIPDPTMFYDILLGGVFDIVWSLLGLLNPATVLEILLCG